MKEDECSAGAVGSGARGCGSTVAVWSKALGRLSMSAIGYRLFAPLR
jgi:hypothetical protein